MEPVCWPLFALTNLSVRTGLHFSTLPVQVDAAEPGGRPWLSCICGKIQFSTSLAVLTHGRSHDNITSMLSFDNIAQR